jgi:hypothetical protein
MMDRLMDGWLNGKTECRLFSDDASLKRFLVSNDYDRIIAFRELQGTKMHSVLAYFKVLSLDSPEEAEENHDDLYQESWWTGRDSNRAETCAQPSTRHAAQNTRRENTTHQPKHTRTSG